MNILYDERVDCYSILQNLSLNDFLPLVQRAHEARGGIEGQRDSLRTSTAKRIRQRLVNDLSRGAVLPPIVVGIIVSSEQFKAISKNNTEEFMKTVRAIGEESVSIIDGMQRTTALIEASELTPALQTKEIRVEFWVTTNVNSLIYRMLVLNTGQVPWNLRRQMEVVFKSMKVEIKKAVPFIDILSIDENKKRTKAAQYQASDLIELYLVFGAKKAIVDTREQLAEEFTRLDVIEGTEIPEFTDRFYESIRWMAGMDTVFDKFKSAEKSEKRFSDGKDLFASQTARSGFVAALAEHIFGRPGSPLDDETRNNRWQSVTEQVNVFLKGLGELPPERIGEFLDFETLNEKLSVKSARVGEFERNFFTKAFSVLIDEKFQFDSFNPSWRAY